MAETHDYPTKPVKGADLNGTHVLVGESGGLSAIYDVRPDALFNGLNTVETEHGMLLLDPEGIYTVLDMPS